MKSAGGCLDSAYFYAIHFYVFVVLRDERYVPSISRQSPAFSRENSGIEYMMNRGDMTNLHICEGPDEKMRFPALV